MASEDEQLELFSGEDEHIVFENTTLTADKVLINNVGRHHDVLLIGVGDDGATYFASHGNAKEWLFWLRRCEEFIMGNSF